MFFILLTINFIWYIMSTVLFQTHNIGLGICFLVLGIIWTIGVLIYYHPQRDRLFNGDCIDCDYIDCTYIDCNTPDCDCDCGGADCSV